MYDKNKLPKMPYGEGSMYMYDDETIAYKKTIKISKRKSVRKVVFGKNPKQCIEKMKELEQELLNNQNKSPEKVVLIEGIYNWLDNMHKPRVKQQTYDRMVKTARNQIEYSNIGHDYYQDVSNEQIQTLLASLNDQGYSHSTIKKTHDLLNAFYRYASAKDGFNNPMELVVMPKISHVKAETKEVQWLEEDEIERFVEACDKTYNNGTLKYKYGYILAANIYLGMRGGELLAAQWKDIDFEKRTIYVSKTLIETENKDYDVNSPQQMKLDGVKRVIFKVQPYTKTSKNRYIPINSKAMELLKKYYDVCKFKEPDDYVISTSNRKTNTLKNLSDAIKAIEQEAEIDKPNNTHILRHTCASLYFKKGVSIEIICQILGNSREVCEKTYVHFVEEQLKDAASKIDVIEI